MALTPVTFGRDFTDTPQPMTVSGQPGWFSVPRQWYCRAFDGGTNQLIVSPNADFSSPNYCAVLGDDGIHYCYQDLYLEKTTGISQ